jgi:hydroxyacylglutathione hydrolase
VRRVAEDVYQLKGFPPDAINVYLVRDVLVDAATRHAGRRILRQLKGREVNAHALTHAHSDHQGASRELCETLNVPFWVGERDADAAERPELILERQPDHPINRLYFRIWSGPGRKVDRTLREGDEVGGFSVLDAPGHSRGHVAFWRESDGVLILGDVASSIDTMTGRRGLYQPKTFFTPDPAENRRSLHRLGELEPQLVLFGHGPPCRDGKRFADFVRSVPR